MQMDSKCKQVSSGKYVCNMCVCVHVLTFFLQNKNITIVIYIFIQ